ncbi:MAG: class I SAM-dependent methyltransferase [Chromatocurvus sp.]
MADLSQLHALARHMTADAWCDAFVQFAAGGENPLGLPAFPAAEVQRITNSQTDAETMRGAADFYRILDETLADHPAGSGPLLDFGAGWGRITRLLLRSLPPEAITACDVDDRLVDAGHATLPGTDFLQIESGKALPFPDGSFSTVIANSVFSHLSEEAHHFYLAEIARILQPGGLFVGTTLSLRLYQKWLERDAYRRWITDLLGPPDTIMSSLTNGEFVYASSGRWSNYGIALLPEDYVTQHWTLHFSSIDTRADYKQDVNLAMKPSEDRRTA